MTPARRIEDAAKTFWQAAGGRKRYGRPVDLERAVAFALPLGICKMPELSTAKVAEVLERIGTIPWSTTVDRSLHGCLVADVGVGLVFLDGSDPPDHQRYSLAHEVAHFLLHYFQPRQHVLEALGPGIAAVLDRQRMATGGERLSSALGGLVLEPFRHAMARTAAGTPTHFRTRSMEAEADDLALEIIAPITELRLRHDFPFDRLAAEYGIPREVAACIAVDGAAGADGGVVSIFGKKSKVNRT